MVVLPFLITQLAYLGGNSLQSTFYLTLQQNNNLLFKKFKKDTGVPLMLEFPTFGGDKLKADVEEEKVSPPRLPVKSKAKAKTSS